MEDTILTVLLILLGVFLLFRIYLLLKTEFFGRKKENTAAVAEGAVKRNLAEHAKTKSERGRRSVKKDKNKKPEEASEDLLIIIDLDEEEI